MSTNPVDEAVREIRRVEVFIEDMIRDVDADPLILPCIKAYILNSIALPIALRICKGESVDTEKLVLRVRKALSNRIGVLTSICTIYKDLLSNNPRVVADIGCGLGLNLNIVRAYTKTPLLIGIDIDMCLLEVFEKLYPDAIAILADALTLPLRGSSIDLAFCTLVIHELPNLGVFSELSRVLKSSGKALILDVVLRFVPSWILNFIRYLRTRLGWEPETPYTLNQIESAIKKQGLGIVKVHAYWKSIIGTVILVIAKNHTRDLHI